MRKIWDQFIGSIRLALSYEKRVWGRAIKDTIEFFGLNKQSLIVPILWLFGLLVYVWIEGLDKAIDEVLVTFAFSLAPIGVFAVLLTLWNMAMAPSRIDNELREKNVELGGKLRGKQKSLEIADYLQNAYMIADELLSRNPSNDDEMWDWITQAQEWYTNTSPLVREYLTLNESFMFDTVVDSAQFREHDYEQNRDILRARNNKLRLIINRYLQDIDQNNLIAES